MNVKVLIEKLNEIVKECPDTEVEILLSGEDARQTLRENMEVQAFDFDINYEPDCLAIITLRPILYFTGRGSMM